MRQLSLKVVIQLAPDDVGIYCGSKNLNPDSLNWSLPFGLHPLFPPVSSPHPPPTPRLPGAGAARHCQSPVIRGQLPWENTRRASG